MLPPKVILSPIDFSSHSQEALQTAADLAKQFGSKLLLVHAVPAITKLPSATSIFHEAEFEQELHKDAEQRLKTLAEELEKKGCRCGPKWESRTTWEWKFCGSPSMTART